MYLPQNSGGNVQKNTFLNSSNYSTHQNINHICPYLLVPSVITHRILTGYDSTLIYPKFPGIYAYGQGISTNKKEYCLWFIQSSNNSLGTRVREIFWDSLRKISNSATTMASIASWKFFKYEKKKQLFGVRRTALEWAVWLWCWIVGVERKALT